MVRDAWLHPVQVVNGPDGALYVAIMNLDAAGAPTSGASASSADSGAGIYRIAPENSPPAPYPKLGGATTRDLVTQLGSVNAWASETAARLLIERRDPHAVPLLKEAVNRSRFPLARLHALGVLDAFGAVGADDETQALRDPESGVRELAVSLLGRLGADTATAESLWLQVSRAAGDPDPRVRYQFAFALGSLGMADRMELLATILSGDPANPWMRAAVFNSAAENPAGLLIALAGDAPLRLSPAGQDTLRELATMIGVQGTMDDVSRVINFILQANLDASSTYSLLDALDEGLHHTRSSLLVIDKEHRLDRIYLAARDASVNTSLPDNVRVPAIRLLGQNLYTYRQSGDLLLLLLRPGESLPVQSAAIRALGEQVDPGVLPSVFRRWPGLTAPLRQEAVTAMLSRIERSDPVMSSLENGNISAADFTPVQINFLRTHPDTSIQQRAVRAFGAWIPNARATLAGEVIPTVPAYGSAGRGRDVFLARCAVCHLPRGDGNSFGPDLAPITNLREVLLTDILDPSQSLAPGYETHVIITADGEVMIGHVTGSNGSAITFQPMNGTGMVLPHQYVASDVIQHWSLMPEEALTGLRTQDLADVLAYLWPAAK